MDKFDYMSWNAGKDFSSGILGGFIIFILFLLFISLIIYLIQLIGLWKVYKKAGKGGWEALIPFYCNWVLVEIAGLNWWWFLFFFAPIISSFFNLELLGWFAYLFGVFNCYYNISKKFNKDVGFAICLTLFTPICIPILGFSKEAIYDSSVVVSNNGVFSQNEQPMKSNDDYQSNMQSLNNNDNVMKQNASFCGNCGFKLNNSEKYCPNCGKQL